MLPQSCLVSAKFEGTNNFSYVCKQVANASVDAVKEFTTLLFSWF